MFQPTSPKKLAWKAKRDRVEREKEITHKQHPTAQDRYLAHERQIAQAQDAS